MRATDPSACTAVYHLRARAPERERVRTQAPLFLPPAKEISGVDSGGGTERAGSAREQGTHRRMTNGGQREKSVTMEA